MPFAVGFLVAGLSLFPAVAIVLARRFWTTGTQRVVVLALAWTALEWVRGHVLTGFPWNLVAYVWGDDLVMLQGLSLFGAYGLSLATAFVAASPAALVEFSSGAAQPARAGTFVWPVVAAALLLSAYGFGVQRLAGPSPTNVPGVVLRIVQPSIPQVRKLNGKEANAIFKTHMGLMTGPGFDAVTHVVWSEAAVPAMLPVESNALAEIGQALHPNQWLLAGQRPLRARRAEFRGPLLQLASPRLACRGGRLRVRQTSPGALRRVPADAVAPEAGRVPATGRIGWGVHPRPGCGDNARARCAGHGGTRLL